MQLNHLSNILKPLEIIVMQILKLLFLLLIFSTVTACVFAYKQDVQQGNIIAPSQIAGLRVGMTKDEVRYLLGTPVLSHVLNQERWDYVYSYQKGKGPMKVSTRLSLYFNHGRLISFREC